MAENNRKIRELPAEVRSQLRSGIVITNMAQCVVELVLNALDAGATSIAIRVNFNYFKVQVIDNGCGINVEELDLVGERFMTSKCHSLNDLCYNLNHFGFRGEALASIREISGLLILESRPQNNEVTYSKAFSHGKAHKADISKTKRPGHGTTVTVHDFMYNMPVRRQRFQSAIDLEEIKTNIESIALIQPQASFSLRNDTNGSLILHTRKCLDTVTAFSHLFGQTLASTLVCVSSSISEFKINGYISKEGHYQKNLQFVYVNKRLVLKTKLHKLANSMLGNSVLLKTNNTANDVPISKDATVGRWLTFSPPRREKHAVYIFSIVCPFHAYDIFMDPKKTLIEFCDWETLLKCLETLIRTFLEKEFSISLRPEAQNDSPQKDCFPEERELCQKENSVGKAVEFKDNLKKKAKKYNYSGSTTRKMLQASRIVKGITAKRKSTKEETQIERNCVLQKNNNIDKEPENEEILGFNADMNLELFTEYSQKPKLDKCELEDSFLSSQTQNVTQRNVDLFSESDVISANKIRKNLNIISDCTSEVPVSNPHFEKSVITKCNMQTSVENLVLDKDSDICPIVKFKKNVNEHRVLTKSQCKHVPPIVKFKKKTNHLSDIQLEVEKKTTVIPLKLFKQNTLKKVLNKSGVNKQSVCIKHNNDDNIFIETEGITVNGYIRPCRKTQNHKNIGHGSSKISTNVKDVFRSNIGYGNSVDQKMKMLKTYTRNNSAYHISSDMVDGELKKIKSKNVIAKESNRNTSHLKVICSDHLTRNPNKVIFEISEENLLLNGTKNVNVSAIVNEEMSNILNEKIYGMLGTSKLHKKSGTVAACKADYKKHWLRQGERAHEDMEHRKQVYPKMADNNSMVRHFCKSSDFLQTPNVGLSIEKVIVSCDSVSFLRKRKYMRDMHPVLKHHDPQNSNLDTYSNCSKSVDHKIQGHLDSDIYDYLQLNENSEKHCLDSEIETNSFKFSPKAMKQDELCFEDIFGISCNKNMPEGRVHIQLSEFAGSGNLLYNRLHERLTCMQEPDFANSGNNNNLYFQGICSSRPCLSRNTKLEQYQRKSMILSSGNEADMELTDKSELEIKKRKNRQITFFNRTCSMHKLNTGFANMKVCENNNSSSNETIKRKICSNKYSKIIGKDILSTNPDIQLKESTEVNLLLRNQMYKTTSEKSINEEAVVSEINRVGVDNINSSCNSENCSDNIIPNVRNVMSDCNCTSDIEKIISESTPESFSQDTDNKSVISNSISEISNHILNRTNKKYYNCLSEELTEISTEHLEMNEEEMSVSCTNNFIRSEKNDNVSKKEIFKNCERKIGSNCSEGTSSLELIAWLDNVKLSPKKVDQMEDLKNLSKGNNGESLSVDKSSSCENIIELNTVNCKENEQLQDEILDNGHSFDKEDHIFMGETSTPVAVTSSESSNNYCINSELTAVLTENSITTSDNKINKQNCVDSSGNVDSNIIENHSISISCNNNGCVNSFLDTTQNLCEMHQDSSIKDTSRNIGSVNKCFEDTPMEVLEYKSDCDSNICENNSQRHNGIVNSDKTSENKKEDGVQVAENDEIFYCHQSSQVNEDCNFSSQLINLKDNKEAQESLKFSNRKRKNETDVQHIDRKKSCTYNCSDNSAERKMSESEIFTSKSISTQELNEAFNRVINIIPTDVDNQKYYSFNVNTSSGVRNEFVGEMEICDQEGQINLNKFKKSRLESDINQSESWEQRVDSDGKIFFIHKQSGMTSFTAPNYSVPPNIYTMEERFGFLPKGFSPILKDGIFKCNDETKRSLTPSKCEALKNVVDSCTNVDDMATVKWKDEELKIGCRDLVKEMLEESDTKMQFCEKEVANAVVQELPKNIVKVYNIMYPCTFKKDIFSNLKILGQLDNKFIVTIVRVSSGLKQDLIVLFDQHAVHERIRLENLLKEYHVEGSESEFRSSEINPHINLKLNDREYRIISNFQREFEKLGLLFRLLDDKEIEVTGVPTCLLTRELREVQSRKASVMKNYLENLIREQVESILVTRGIGVKTPTVLQSVISSEACRGALKFGDPLFPDECEVLLKNLSECQVPFQCAHGRPALMPIVDLKYLQSQESQMRSKPNLWKLRKGTKD